MLSINIEFSIVNHIQNLATEAIISSSSDMGNAAKVAQSEQIAFKLNQQPASFPYANR